ncbi:HAMP domain-containing sensor histidine kinase [Clostridium sp. C2-6-12]|uniref:sensor histidine kinase n=1 Tax=Clostridium sp. C2-6-12 TaxID=2698832 RepID=UPI001368B94A|nr:HAMP domain-containing sensor histidine kinase [Clostridium sp. C2-6-12]
MKGKRFGGIRVEFLFVFLISAILSIVFALIINDVWRNKQTDYSHQISKFNSECNRIYAEIIENSNNEEKIKEIVNRDTNLDEVFIVDTKGNVIISHNNRFEKQFDINKILEEQGKTNFNNTKIKYYYVNVLDNNKYVLITQILYMGDNFNIFPLGIVIFLIIFFVLTYGRVKYINYLSKGVIEIAKGDLNYRVQIKGRDELSLLGKNINYMTEELKQLKEREKEAEKNKDRLIVSVSHDLRTPLTSIIGYIKLIKENSKLDNDIKRYIDIIDNKAERLENLINDLFEYTKLRACDVKIEKINISLNEFMRQVVEGMMPICNQNNLNIVLEAPEKEVKVNVDPNKMLRVFENIISNAIKYSNKDSTIKINISNSKDVLITIENEGTTIKYEELNKIFEMFYRTDKSRNNKTGGAGIGLSIAKSIVELHKGKIWADCQGNKVCFYVLIL